MRWLAVCSMLLIVLLTLTIQIVRAVGSTRPPTIDSIYTEPDGTHCDQPCLFGVRPGQTTAREAAAILRSHPLTRDFDLISTAPFRIEAHDDWIMMITFNVTADQIVDEITIARYIRYGRAEGDKSIPLPDPGTLGDTLSHFGSPDFMQLTTGGDPSLVYANLGVVANLVRTRGEAGRIALSQPLSRLTIFRQDTCPSSAFLFTFPRWLGAAHFFRYTYATNSNVKIMVRRMDSVGTTFAPCRE